LRMVASRAEMVWLIVAISASISSKISDESFTWSTKTKLRFVSCVRKRQSCR
jgi:hypothetical protein